MPIDAGELAASQYTFGISHPSGYPLFNLIGFLWSKLPIGTVIFRLNLLSAIFVALANFFMVKIAFIILKNSFSSPSTPTKGGSKKSSNLKPQPSALLQLLASISGILVLAFCKTWWIQSAGVEVYSLHIALLAIFFFVFIKTFYKSNPTYKDWVIIGFFLGFCFTNHLTSMLILPGVVVLYFIKMKFTVTSIKSGLIMAGCFAVVFLSFYGLMIFRAGSSPLVNYGNPDNMEYLKRHITGWQFQSFMGGDDKQSNNTIAAFFNNFANESAVIGLLLFLAGIIYGFVKNIKMGVFWGLNFLSALIYASQYSIHDIENYFLLSYMSVGIFMVFGVYWIFTLIKGIENNKAVFLILLLPILPLAMNYNTTDQSKLHYIDQYSIAALNSVEENAIIISREWDVFVSPAYYYHLVEKQRPDVLILDKELLRRSWYHNQIKVWDKTFAAKIEKQANEFNEAVLPFERQQTKDGSKIQPQFEAYITAILSEYKNRPVYVSSWVYDYDIRQGVDVKLPPGTQAIPDAYFYRIVPIDNSIYYPLAHPLEYHISFMDDKKDEKFQQIILNCSMGVLSSRVGYEMIYGKKVEARKIIEIMQSINPGITMPEGL